MVVSELISPPLDVSVALAPMSSLMPEGVEEDHLLCVELRQRHPITRAATRRVSSAANSPGSVMVRRVESTRAQPLRDCAKEDARRGAREKPHEIRTTTFPRARFVST
jgi:hypothetical protein